MITTLAASLLLVATGCAPTYSPRADYPAYSTAEDLAAGADIVATVTFGDARDTMLYPNEIDSSDPEENPGLGAKERPTDDELAIPMVVHEATIKEVFAGNVKAGQNIEIKRAGTLTEAPGQLAELRKDMTYIVFLVTYPNAAADIMGGDAGQFVLDGDKITPANKSSEISVDLRYLRGLE